jgi:mevalonate kinase
MAVILGETTVPGCICLFGQFGTLIGEPTVNCAIDKHVSVKIKPSSHDFSIIDGYKLDPSKHGLFDLAEKKFWKKGALEFDTSSQIPLLSGLGTQTAVIAAISGLLLTLKRNEENNKNPTLTKKRYTKGYLARQTYKLDSKLDPAAAPVAASSVFNGGLMYQSITGSDNLWSVKSKNNIWNINAINTLDDVPIVLGYLQQKSTKGFSSKHSKPLYDSPIKQKKAIPGTKYGAKQSNSSTMVKENNASKIKQLLGHRGFAKDVLKDMGKITKKGIQCLNKGDLQSLGDLMNEQLNLLRILGIYPKELQKLLEVAENNSIAVSISGTNCDIVLALTEKPDEVARDIEGAGGTAIITNIDKNGFKVKLG